MSLYNIVIILSFKWYWIKIIIELHNADGEKFCFSGKEKNKTKYPVFIHGGAMADWTATLILSTLWSRFETYMAVPNREVQHLYQYLVTFWLLPSGFLGVRYIFSQPLKLHQGWNIKLIISWLGPTILNTFYA